ncbi:MAG: helix-turn-helix domain-containing protein [Thermodesulfobacteriota bacterium]
MAEERQFVTAPLLSVSEAAAYLGVGRKVVYRLLEEGRIAAVKAGRTTRIEKRSLDEFRARGELT